jgi:hypothetical protein
MPIEPTVEMVPIQYRGFWDVPRIFLARHRGRLFLFESRYDEEVEEHADSFTVYELPIDSDAELPKDWTTLSERALKELGQISVEDVQFDPSKRQAVDAGVFQRFSSKPMATAAVTRGS